VGYDERGCAARLGVTSMRDAARPLKVYRQLPDAARVRPVLHGQADPLDILVALFLFRQRVPVETLARALGPGELDAFLEMRVLEREEGSFSSHVLLFPADGLLVATDRLGLEPGFNKVMPLFPESFDLARLTIRRPSERALDLCAGSGIHALLASRHCREAVGVDLSPRAAAFSGFNAWLNDIGNVRFLAGDLYAPLEPGTRFDLVTANPPYNPEIDSAAGEDYHSGGESGEEVLEQILRGLPERLSPAGLGQIITLLIDREGERAEDRFRRWLGAGWDLLLLTRAVDYRPLVMKGEGLAGRDKALQESWRRQRIFGFRFGAVTVRRTPPGRTPLLAEAPFGDGGAGGGPAVDTSGPLSSNFSSLLS
jgi:methylase of polypeptide subunit release factors